MKHGIALIHTSAPAIAPLMQYYGKMAPELELINLLDDGILPYFRNGDLASVEAALIELIERAQARYGAQAVVLTCSSVSGAMLASLQKRSLVPVLKVDVPMAEAAQKMGGSVGIAYTFAPTLGPTSSLFPSGTPLLPHWIEGAYDALLSGQNELHDQMVLAGLEELQQQGADVIVLAQVSMARVLAKLRPDFSVPVLSSQETSLAAIRELFAAS